MNNQPITEHPAEEALMEFAIQPGNREIENHVKSCEACARTVKEFREVGRQVASLADEEIPARVEQRVLRLTRHGAMHGHAAARSKGGGIGALFANPFLMTLLVLLLLLGLYFLVGSEVFRAQ